MAADRLDEDITSSIAAASRNKELAGNEVVGARVVLTMDNRLAASGRRTRSEHAIADDLSRERPSLRSGATMRRCGVTT